MNAVVRMQPTESVGVMGGHSSVNIEAWLRLLFMLSQLYVVLLF